MHVKHKKWTIKLAGHNDKTASILLVIAQLYLRLPTRKICSHPPIEMIKPKVGQNRRSTVSVAEYFG
jgi:hypothetical protein